MELPPFHSIQPPDGAQHVHTAWGREYRRRLVDPTTARAGLDQEWNGNLFQLVAPNVEATPDKTALTWLDEKGDVALALTFGEVERRATAVAALLRKQGVKQGECVVVCFPPGLEFVPAFLGCLQVGAVAVPVYPPNPSKLARDLVKFRLVAEDCGARHVLTSRKFFWVMKVSSMKHRWPQGVKWHATDSLKPPRGRAWNELCFAAAARRLEGGWLAFLQYTSGSTGKPKGVMIGHGNLHHNMLVGAGRILAHVLPEREQACILTWVPQYHDLGLMSTYLGALVDGGGAVAMSPLSFLRDPVLWVRMLSRHRCTHTTAPNFSYELVMRKFDAARLPAGEPLDLSCLRWVGNAAEPVRADTMERFQAMFEPYGMRPGIFRPMFGMAESVVYVTDATEVLTFPDPDGHRRVACGRPCNRVGVDVRIVDPESRREVPRGEMGEIWICSPSVAQGYYNRPEQTAETFGARIEGVAAGDPAAGRRYLRAGDLAQLIDGHLVYGGRIKDLIIIRGRNYHPHDVEMAVQSASPLVRPGCVAAFSVGGDESTDADATEQLVVVAELRGEVADAEYQAHPNLTRKGVLDRMAADVRREVQMAVGLGVSELVLIEQRTIPKTTSGKIRRRATREARAEGKLREVERWSWRDSDSNAKQLLASESIEALSKIGRTMAAAGGGTDDVAGADDDDDAAAEDAGLSAPASRPGHRRRRSRQLMKEYGVADQSKTLTENGLDSLHLTQFLQQVREQTGVDLEMRDVMELNVSELLKVIGSEQNGLASDEPPTRRTARAGEPAGRQLPEWARHAVQTVGILLVLLVPAACLIPAYYWTDYVSNNFGRPWSSITFGRAPTDAEMEADESLALSSVHMFGLLSVLAIPLWCIVYSLAVVAVKWTVVGRYAAGSYRVHSPHYLAWWFVDRNVGFWEFFVGRFVLGTKTANFYYRLMGARVAWSASINHFLREADLVTVGEGSTMSGRVYPRLVEPDRLWMDTVVVGANCTVDIGCVVLPGCEFEDGVELLPNTVVMQGSTLVPLADHTWQGNPCRRVPKDGTREPYQPPPAEQSGELEMGVLDTAGAPAIPRAAAADAAAPGHRPGKLSVVIHKDGSGQSAVAASSLTAAAAASMASPGSPGSPLSVGSAGSPRELLRRGGEAGAATSTGSPRAVRRSRRHSSPDAGAAARAIAEARAAKEAAEKREQRRVSAPIRKEYTTRTHASVVAGRESAARARAAGFTVQVGLEAAKILSLGALIVTASLCGVPVRLFWHHVGRLPNFRYTLPLYFATVYFFTMLVFAALTVCAKWALFGRVRPGVYLDTPFEKWRRWVMGALSKVAFSLTLLFDYSRFNTLWLRAMGVRKVLNSPVLNPTGSILAQDADLVEVESDNIFVSSVAVRCDRSVGNGYRSRRPLRLGSNSWVGLATVLEGGVTLNRRSAVGAASFLPAGTEVDERSTAFGNPHMIEKGAAGAVLDSTEAAGAGSSPLGELAHVCMCLLQVAVAFACVLPAYELGRYFNTTLGLPVEVSLLLVAVDAVALVVSLCLCALAFKWALVGHTAEGERPATSLNSSFFVRYAGANRFNYYVRVYVLQLLHGTIWSVWYHRAMGADISSSALIYTASVLDHDQLTIAEGAVLDVDCYAICHVLQQQHFYVGPMRVGRRSVMQPHAVCFNNDHVEDGATLGALSKCFPGQAVRSGEHWQGNPAHHRRLLESAGSFKRQSSALQNVLRQSATLASLTTALRRESRVADAADALSRLGSLRGMNL